MVAGGKTRSASSGSMFVCLSQCPGTTSPWLLAEVLVLAKPESATCVPVYSVLFEQVKTPKMLLPPPLWGWPVHNILARAGGRTGSGAPFEPPASIRGGTPQGGPARPTSTYRHCQIFGVCLTPGVTGHGETQLASPEHRGASRIHRCF